MVACAGLMGWVLASLVLLWSVLTAGECVDGTWGLSFGVEHLVSGSWRALPPGTRCTVSRADGSVVAERVRPGTRSWIAAFVLGLWPLGVTGIILVTLRRIGRMTGGPNAGAG